MSYSTFGEIAKLVPESLDAAVINTFLHKNPLLENMPMEFWGSNSKYATYAQQYEADLPTTAEYDDGDTLSDSETVRRTQSVYLKRFYGQWAPENFSLGSLSGGSSGLLAAHAQSFGKMIATEIMTGVSCTVAISAGSGTKGVDACNVGPRIGVTSLATVDGALKYVDAASTLQYKAPGDSAYGAVVDVTANLAVAHHKLLSDNPGNWIYLTFDTSDSTGADWEYTDALTFTTNKKFDGLFRLCHPDQRVYGTLSETVPSTNGDAVALAQLDYMIDQVQGDPSELMFVVHERTVRSLRPLLTGAIKPAEYKGKVLDGLQYRGIPIVSNRYMSASETVGSTTNCTSMFLVRLSRENGVFMFWGSPGAGAKVIQLPDNSLGYRSVPVPVWSRWLGEPHDKDVQRFRITSHLAMGLKSPQGLAEIHGITN